MYVSLSYLHLLFNKTKFKQQQQNINGEHQVKKDILKI